MVGIVHLNVAVGGITSMTIVLEIARIAAFQDVDFGVVNLGIYVVIHSSVFGAEVLGTRWMLAWKYLERKSEAYKVGARFALNSQWNMRTVFPESSPLMDGLGLSALAPKRNSSTAVVVLMLRAPGICPPLYS